MGRVNEAPQAADEADVQAIVAERFERSVEGEFERGHRSGESFEVEVKPADIALNEDAGILVHKDNRGWHDG